MPRGRERILDEGKQREVCALFTNEYAVPPLTPESRILLPNGFLE